MKQVLKRLREHNLYLKPQKCVFNMKEVEYLRMIISPGQIVMDLAKLARIADWPVPLAVKQVRSFLGFTNFYWRFINWYSDLA